MCDDRERYLVLSIDLSPRTCCPCARARAGTLAGWLAEWDYFFCTAPVSLRQFPFVRFQTRSGRDYIDHNNGMRDEFVFRRLLHCLPSCCMHGQRVNYGIDRYRQVGRNGCACTTGLWKKKITDDLSIWIVGTLLTLVILGFVPYTTQVRRLCSTLLHIVDQPVPCYDTS